MPDNRLTRTFLTLGIFCALVYLGNFAAHVISRFAHMRLLLAVAWMIAFVLKPVAQWLDRGLLPRALTERVRRRWGARCAYP